MHPPASKPASSGVLHESSQAHVPRRQKQSTEALPQAFPVAGYPQVAPSALQELPLSGITPGQGDCQVPLTHWQLDSQPTIPVVQNSDGEHVPPSWHLSAAWPPLFDPHAPKLMASMPVATAPPSVSLTARERRTRSSCAASVPGVSAVFCAGKGFGVVPHRAAP